MKWYSSVISPSKCRHSAVERKRFESKGLKNILLTDTGLSRSNQFQKANIFILLQAEFCYFQKTSWTDHRFASIFCYIRNSIAGGALLAGVNCFYFLLTNKRSKCVRDGGFSSHMSSSLYTSFFIFLFFSIPWKICLLLLYFKTRSSSPSSSSSFPLFSVENFFFLSIAIININLNLLLKTGFHLFTALLYHDNGWGREGYRQVEWGW